MSGPFFLHHALRAWAGGEKQSRSRDAPSHPSFAKPRKLCLHKDEGRRSAGRRKCLGATPCESAAARCAKARSPLGAPPRFLSRRPNAATQPRPRFTPRRGRGRDPHRHSRLSEAPRAPVVMPAGTMPGPPGSGVTSPARRNRARPVSRLSPVDAPSWVSLGYVTIIETYVNENVTNTLRADASSFTLLRAVERCCCGRGTGHAGQRPRSQ